MNAELDQYRQECRAWLAENASSCLLQDTMSVDEEIALARKWQSVKADSGYAAITLPVEYGGAGKSELHKIVFSEEEMQHRLPRQYFIISL
ncbi:MAG: alkylation response protein AidB-like acyl-CoA dehydrogenase, partial [Paracoccaceae bacterium]